MAGLEGEGSEGIHLVEKTPKQEQEELFTASEKLREAGIPLGAFDRNAIIKAGHSFNGYMKMIKYVTNYTEGGFFDTLLVMGGSKKLYPIHSKMDHFGFVRFARWLQSKEGQDEIYTLQREQKLLRKAGESLTPTQMIKNDVFNLIRTEFSRAMKAEREKFEQEKDELRRLLRQKEREERQAFKNLQEKFAPISFYREPTDEEVGIAAYEMYENEARKNGKTPMSRYHGGDVYARQHFSQAARELAQVYFASNPENQDIMERFMKERFLFFGRPPMNLGSAQQECSWLALVERKLWKMPLQRRLRLTGMIPIGILQAPGRRGRCRELRRKLSPDLLASPRQVGVKLQQGISRKVELTSLGPKMLRTSRIRVLRSLGPERPRAIPVARSRFEAGVRKVIGGGAMRSWEVDSQMYRGGGNSADALRLLGQARDDRPGAFLSGKFTQASARLALLLPNNLDVPDGAKSTRMKNFNNDATAGPFLRSFGIKGKYGLKRKLEEEMWRYYDDYGAGRIDSSGLPFFTARVGFRTKLVSVEKAEEKFKTGQPFGRAVMMLDALEQAAASPLYNVLSHYTFERRLRRDCGFKNAVIRASSDWNEIWKGVREAEAIIELDWSKFDRERPAEDLEFIVDVVISCFKPRNERERRLLRAYGIMMRRALIERLLVMDGGGVFGIEGMVPSGSLWTGWIDTALNVLYLRSACLEVGLPSQRYLPMCAGDDNLTLFWSDPGEVKLLKIRELLNEWYRAGIDDADFFIHRPPYHVVKRQACFPPGTDLKGGTSMLMKDAEWVEFEGELRVDEAAGRSHRWQYLFKGRPKFLSCYWTRDGLPIRPTSDNLEKLLWPEGIHKSIDDYEASVASMAVDNPFNHHNVNHMLMRYVIIQQIRRVSAGILSPEECLAFCKFRSQEGEEIPYPMVAPWRRGMHEARMEDYPETKPWVKEFRDFISGVSSLYARKPTGGVDAYRFMEIIRGEQSPGEGQFGSDLVKWVDWLRKHPVTKFLRATGGRHHQKSTARLEGEDLRKVEDAFMALRERLGSGQVGSTEDFSLWVSDLLRSGM
ncbi:fusion protein [Spinach amalgavirus 1]|uniref:Fusion protein n=1 Tax=Spinach amalgavirus 1 TaxID=1985164 RepID=A0A1W6S3T2_9VIRU|nr:fusion protein [Spinach amalgavirus 1]ARO72612.1 fusion protein [Spinach amalgavirus 1]